MQSKRDLARLNSTAFPLSQNLTDAEFSGLLREVAAGTEDSARRSVLKSTQLELERERSASIILPSLSPNVSPPPESWYSAVSTAAQMNGSGASVTSLLPEASRQVDERSRRSAPDLERVLQEIDSCEADLSDTRERREIYFAKSERSHLPAAELTQLQRLLRFLWVLETLVVVSVFAAYFGIFDTPSILIVPIHTWLQVLGLSLPSVVATFALSIATTWVLRQLGSAASGLKRISALILGSTLLFFISLGVLRWSASHSALDVGGVASAAGSLALLILIPLTSLIVAALAAVLTLKAEDLKTRIADALRAEEHFDNIERRLKAHIAQLQSGLVELRTEVEGPIRLRVAFEQSVQALRSRLAYEESVLAEKEHHVRSAYRYLKQLSVPMREALIDEIYQLRPITENQGKKPTQAGARRFLPFLSLLLLGLMGGGSLGGCKAPQPSHLIVACDPSGARPDLTCSSELLTEAAAAWGSDAVNRAGSTLHVVMSAGSYGSTQVHPIAAAPHQFQGGIRSARLNWRKATVQSAAHINILRDRGHLNRSDLLSLLVVSTKEASRLTGECHLQIASDGWLISGPFNAEQSVPRAEDILTHLKAERLKLSLSHFSTITICGFHNIGTDRAHAAARERLWVELIEALQGPSPVLSRSCADLYPETPSALLTRRSLARE